MHRNQEQRVMEVTNEKDEILKMLKDQEKKR